MDNAQPTVYLLSDDLIDASKTITAARAIGIVVKQFRSPELLSTALVQPPSLVILDLQSAGLDVAGIIRQGARAIGYGSHVDAARLREARQAGCEVVLPRSRYFEEMPTKIADWISGTFKESSSQCSGE